MKKIMFNDRYGLTEALLSGRKTQTRRIASKDTPLGSWEETEAKTHYKVGEVVAVAQSYNDFYNDECDPRQFPSGAGWTNKMFVRADLMPHRIRITNVRLERLQDISDEDCIKEGVIEACVNNNWGNCASHWEYNVPYEDDLGRAKLLRGLTPQEAYAALIDRISGNGTWESNPWVFVYDFELAK